MDDDDALSYRILVLGVSILLIGCVMIFAFGAFDFINVLIGR